MFYSIFGFLKTIGHAKNRLCQWKLEVTARSLYTWVKPMSKLWRFVYIASHVTLHAKPNAQKVNCCLMRFSAIDGAGMNFSPFDSKYI